MAEHAVRCTRCTSEFPIVDGVLDLTSACDDAVLRREREAARETERNPGLGGINERFEDLSAADGPLKGAILALPYGDGSKYYREPGYFANVQGSAAAFDFLVLRQHASPEHEGDVAFWRDVQTQPGEVVAAQLDAQAIEAGEREAPRRRRRRRRRNGGPGGAPGGSGE